MFLSMESEGEGVGKSALLYSAPLPLVCFAFDAGVTRSLYGTLHKRWEGVDIKVIDYPQPGYDWATLSRPLSKLPGEIEMDWWARNEGRCITVYMLPQPAKSGLRPVGVLALWNYFNKLVETAILSPFVTTVGVDTATLGKKISADAYLEGLPGTRLQLIQIEYGKPYGMLRSIYSLAQNQIEMRAQSPVQKHFIITHHMRDVYKDFIDNKGEKQSIPDMDEKGKQRVETDFIGDTRRYVDVDLRLTKNLVPDVMQPGQKVQAFDTEFLKCGFDAGWEGKHIASGDWDWLVDHVNRNLHPMGQVQKRGF